MNAKDKRFIRENMTADKITFKTDGTIEFKSAYFYHNGRSARTWANAVVKKLTHLLFDVELVEASDNWAAWPKTSYLTARVRASRTSLLSPIGA